MEFKDEIKQLGERVSKIKDQILTEEATKHAFIMPFLQILGYDIFDPTEVIPEYITDIGIKKGEKIDYAIMRDGVPEILIECKHHKEDLLRHDDQLRRYFHVSPARFAIITNGIEYRFFTDIVDANKMDEKPFLVVNITNIKPDQIEGITKFRKQNFSRDSLFDAVKVLKHTAEIKSLFHQELANPGEDFVKVFASKIYTSGNVTARILQQFTDLTRISLTQYINDLVTDRVNAVTAAKEQELQVAKTAESLNISDQAVHESGIVTTAEELEGYYIVKTILRQKVDSKRITYRDALSYFAIFLDDNNRKPICRLHFNGPKKYIGTFDSAKNETRTQIDSLDDIFKQTKALQAILTHYLSAQAGVLAAGGVIDEVVSD
jgi:predicted type IV restriction endonuclease